jgi:hypothetical protein
MVAQFIEDKCPLVHEIAVATQAHKPFIEMGSGILIIVPIVHHKRTRLFWNLAVAFQSQAYSTNTSTLGCFRTGQWHSSHRPTVQTQAHKAVLELGSGIPIIDK